MPRTCPSSWEAVTSTFARSFCAAVTGNGMAAGHWLSGNNPISRALRRASALLLTPSFEKRLRR